MDGGIGRCGAISRRVSSMRPAEDGDGLREHSPGSHKISACDGGDPQVSRLALYLPPTSSDIARPQMRSTFAAAASQARVVTAVAEAPGGLTLGGPVLEGLLDRLKAGEFDLIWATIGMQGDGAVLRIERSSHIPIQPGEWVDADR